MLLCKLEKTFGLTMWVDLLSQATSFFEVVKEQLQRNVHPIGAAMAFGAAITILWTVWSVWRVRKVFRLPDAQLEIIRHGLERDRYERYLESIGAAPDAAAKRAPPAIQTPSAATTAEIMAAVMTLEGVVQQNLKRRAKRGMVPSIVFFVLGAVASIVAQHYFPSP
jgi:hypothetical protein